MLVTESQHPSHMNKGASSLICLPPAVEVSPVQSILFQHQHLYSKDKNSEIIYSFLKVEWSSSGFPSKFCRPFSAIHQSKSLSNKNKTHKEPKLPTERLAYFKDFLLSTKESWTTQTLDMDYLDHLFLLFIRKPSLCCVKPNQLTHIS